MAVAVEVHFKQTDTLPRKNSPLRGVWRNGFNGTGRVLLPPIRPTSPERDLRVYAKKAGYKIVGVWKKTASGAKDDRSMLDLFHTLQAWGVSLVAQTGLQFDLRTARGKLIASLMTAMAEFERDLLRERVRSGIAAARKRGVVFDRRLGQRVRADRHAPWVLKLVGEGQS